MALQFEHAFTVKAPPDRVWSYLTDPYRVAPALPGASITEKVDDQTYNGGITVKVGPVSAKYKGTVRFASLDPATRTAEIVARGQDTGGRGGADMKMTSRIVEKSPGESEVRVVSEVSVTGIMAQFGRGLMQDVSDQMLQRFTDSMRAELERSAGAPEMASPDVSQRRSGAAAPAVASAPAPLDVVSLGTHVAGHAAGRLVRRPAFWLVLIALVLAGVYWALN
jgi:uncharacterized protein